jgi:predicted HicB family RNase H-like nuclease
MSKDTKSVLYVRIISETHRRARVRALTDGLTLAAVVEAALAQYLATETREEVQS